MAQDKNWVEAPLAATQQMGSEFQISQSTSPEADRYHPVVAHNWRHGEYLVAWHNKWPDGHRDIYAQRVSESGELLGPWFAITAGPYDRTQPALAYNAINDEYLVVWMFNASGDGSTYEIWGRTIAWNGGYMNTEFQIITWANRSFWTPRVAWNSLRNEYLVVWTAVDTTTGLPNDVAHALLLNDGTKIFGTIISSEMQPHQPDVAYNIAKDEFLVVWRRMWGAADGDIRAARISGDTAVVVSPPGIFTVSAVVEDELLPSVATNQQNRYVVAWQRAYPGPCCDWDIWAQELDANGGLVDSAVMLAGSTDDETAPRVAAWGGFDRRYMAVWQRTTAASEVIQGRWWDDKSFLFFDIADYAFWESAAPVVAAGKTGFLTVYEGDATADPTVYRHIYGRRWVPYAIYLPLTMRIP